MASSARVLAVDRNHRPDERPLCVDLDGTLLRTDTLVESALAAARTDPLFLLALPFMLLRGRAYMKERLSKRIGLDAASLPYDEDLLAFLRTERSTGRMLVLATAANRTIADAVAKHLDLFDEVIASDAVHNLKGPAKADALVERFGERGFDYVGNDGLDFAVWDHAAAAIVAHPSQTMLRKVQSRYEDVAAIGARTSRLKPLLKAMRPHQWVKNVLVFVPLITVGALGDVPAVSRALVTFVAFCIAASGVYVSNDLMDLTVDRRHPRKRLRPFASGDLPVWIGIILSPALLASGLAIANLAGVAGLVGAYALISFLYSAKFKELALVDVFVLASLYTARIVTGGVASGHLVSLWLLAFSCFIFLSLGFIKRAAELSVLDDKTSRIGRRGYYGMDSQMLPTMGVTASFVAAIILALYVQEVSLTGSYRDPLILWATVPLLLFWQCRLWLSTARGYMNDDPIVYAARDRVSWVVGIFFAAAVGLARLPPLFHKSLFLASP